MNAKNAAPLIVTLPTIAAVTPPLIIGAAICYGGCRLLKWLDMDNCMAEFLGMSDDADKEHRRNEAEVMPVPTPRASTLDTPSAPRAPAASPRPALVIPSVSGGNSVQNTSIPQYSGGIPNVTPHTPPHTPAAPPVMPSTPSVPSMSASMPSAIPAMNIVTQVPLPPPPQKKFITREDVASIFQRGARALSRTTAVAALKNLGFGKSAAYDALSEGGRFSAWLQFAPDGIITWKS
jgi:hypothetical protein